MSNSSVKKGVSECQSVMFFAAWGDCGVEAAKTNGNISEISHVDKEAKTFLGIYSSYTHGKSKLSPADIALSKQTKAT